LRGATAAWAAGARRPRAERERDNPLRPGGMTGTMKEAQVGVRVRAWRRTPRPKERGRNPKSRTARRENQIGSLESVTPARRPALRVALAEEWL